MGDLNKRPINMEGEAKNSNLQIAHLDLVQMYINLESTLAAKDERITDLTAVLKLIDDDIRHHLRGDDIAPALVRTHAIKALRDVLRGAKGQWANIVSELRKELSAKDARIAELEAHCKRLGQGGAERYWENRWRDEAAHNAELEALLRETREYVVGFVEIHLPKNKGIVIDDEVKQFVGRIDAALSGNALPE